MSTAPSTPTPTPATWTTRTLLGWIGSKLAEREVDSPRRMAELLLAHVIGCDRLKLYMDTDRLATDDERAALRDLVKRAMNHEPIQYLVGKETFYTLEFKTDARALIPRPSTQTIIDEAIRVLRPAKVPSEIRTEDPDADSGDPAEQAEGSPAAEPQPLLIADVCTGTGCIAITLARNLPGARLIATDLSPDALSLAGENAEAHGLTDRVEFRTGDLLGPLSDLAPGSLDAVVSNPPYIPDHEWDAVEPNVKNHEPHLALRAGADGLRFVTPLIDRAPGLLRPGGVLLIEIASCTARECLDRARANPMLTDARTLKDLDGLDRVLVATRAG